MKKYNVDINIIEHGKNSEDYLFFLIKENIKNYELIKILIIDLSFLHPRAQVNNYIKIDQVEFLHDNCYALHYKLEYEVYNGCSNMDESGDYDTCMIFTINDNSIEFDDIDIERTTIEEF